MSEDIKGKCCGCGKEISVWDNVAYLDDNGTKKYYCRKCFKETFEGDYPYLPSFFSGFEMEIDLNKNPLKKNLLKVKYLENTKAMFRMFLDSSQVVNAYPELLTTEMRTYFDEISEKYIAEQCLALNIDKDVLSQQAIEIQRLREKCEKAYQQGRSEGIDEFIELLSDEITDKEHIIETEEGDTYGLSSNEICFCIEEVEKELKEQTIDNKGE